VVLQRSKTGLKVSLVVGDLSKSGAGRWGGAVRPFLLAQALSRLGCDIKIVGFSFGDAPNLNSAPFPVVCLPGQPYPQFFNSVRALLKHMDGDLVYAYKPKASSFGVSLVQKALTKRPLFLDIDDWELSWHGGDDWHYRPSMKQLMRDVFKPEGALRIPDHPLYLRWMEKLVSRADAVTLHTQFLQKRFGGTYIPNGKDTNLFDPDRYDPTEMKARYNLTDYQVLMFPGAPRPYKGVEDILMALDQLNQPDLRLVIVGGSPYDNYDRELVERWGRWIIKLPTFSYDGMPGVIAAADVIVVPQRDTPAAQAQFPLKLTDGMSMAKPILATRVGDIPQILGDTGYLVDSEAPDQLAETIQWIFQHPEEARAKGIAARERCVQHHSIDAMAATLSTVIDRCFLNLD
jgi:glycosyltransferase involved in cell wall biosynthesis